MPTTILCWQLQSIFLGFSLEALQLRKTPEAPILTGNHSESLTHEKEALLDGFLAVSFIVDIE